MINDQDLISSKNLHHGKGVKEDHEFDQEGTGFFSTLVGLANDKRSHSKPNSELNKGEKEAGNVKIESTYLLTASERGKPVGHLKGQASKIDLAGPGSGPKKKRFDSKKPEVSPEEILKVASLLTKLGAESATPVKTSGVSGQAAEKLSGNMEKANALKTDLANADIKLNNGKVASAKGMTSPEEILKVASLLNKLGTESAKSLKIFEVPGQAAEKLSGNPDKANALKTDLANADIKLNNGKVASAKGMTSPEEVLKVASLLKELGAETTKPVKLSGVSGKSVEKLSGNPEKAPAPKADLAGAGLELNKGKAAAAKVMTSPKEILKVASLLKELGAEAATAVKTSGVSGQTVKNRSGNLEKGRKESFFEATSLKTGAGHSNREASVEDAKPGDMNGQGKKDLSSNFTATSRAGTGSRENIPRETAAEETSLKLKTGSEDANVKTGKTEIPDEILSAKMVKKTESRSSGNSHVSSGNNVPPDKMTGALFQSKEAPVSKETVQADTLKQIVRKAKLNLGNGRSEFKIDLKPESLGHLKMRISTENNQVTVKIVAETYLVKEMIESNVNQLKENFKNQGLVVEKFDVSVGQDSKQQGVSYDTGHSHGRERTGDNPGHGREGYTGQGEDFEQKDRSIKEAMNEGSVDFFA